jgi:hypothetical protein
MKECKYNDFSVRFMNYNETTEHLHKKYQLFLFHEGILQRDNFLISTNQIVFDFGDKNLLLGNFEKFLILKNGINLSLLWTSFKGKSEEINVKSGTKNLFDYLILSFIKKKQKMLYVGNDVNAALAGWRNQINLDVISDSTDIVDKFLKNSVESYLPF